MPALHAKEVARSWTPESLDGCSQLRGGGKCNGWWLLPVASSQSHVSVGEQRLPNTVRPPVIAPSAFRRVEPLAACFPQSTCPLAQLCLNSNPLRRSVPSEFSGVPVRHAVQHSPEQGAASGCHLLRIRLPSLYDEEQGEDSVKKTAIYTVVPQFLSKLHGAIKLSSRPASFRSCAF
jgi:hypothetical protein